MLRLDDPQVRALAAGLLLPMDPAPLPENVRPASWQDRLKGVLGTLAERERQNRLRDLRRALAETDEADRPGRLSCLTVRISTSHEPAAGHEERRVLTRRSVREGGFWMDKLDEGIKTLLELGKRRGFLTFDQVNDLLPDEATSPERIHSLLETLDEMGIELINEDEAETRLLASGDLDDEPDDELAEEPLEDEETELTTEDLEDISRRIDDPVRMYLTQMGEIPLLTREQEINLAKKIEVTRKRFRRKVLECHFALALVVDVLKKVNDGELPFDRTVKVSVTENLEKDQILGRMPHNLKTLEHLMECNVRDFRDFVREREAGRAAGPAGQPQAAPVQGGQPRRGTVDPDPEGPAPHEAAGADRRPHGRAARPAQRAAGRPRRQGRSGQPRQGAQGPDADHARDSQEPQAACRADE